MIHHRRRSNGVLSVRWFVALAVALVIGGCKTRRWEDGGGVLSDEPRTAEPSAVDLVCQADGGSETFVIELRPLDEQGEAYRGENGQDNRRYKVRVSRQAADEALVEGALGQGAVTPEGIFLGFEGGALTAERRAGPQKQENQKQASAETAVVEYEGLLTLEGDAALESRESVCRLEP